MILRTTVLLALALVPNLAPAQTLLDHYRAGMLAREDGDFGAYAAEMRAALALEPGHPILQCHLARANAGLGRVQEALDWMHRAFDQGAWLDPVDDPFLEPLRETAGWQVLLARADSLGAHRGSGRIGFEIEEYDLMPEGIDYDPVSDRFVLGSARKRKIVLVDRDGHTEEFVSSGEDDLLAVLGVRVDPDRRRLWAVSVGDPAIAGTSDDFEGVSRVHCWSLDDAKLLGRWEVNADSVVHGFNDLALRDDGRVVITASASGALFEADPTRDSLHELLAPGSLRSPNGITIDGDTAWVSEYVYGVTRVDLESGSLSRVRVPENIALIGIDGLYRHGSEFVAVQNYAGLDRVAAFSLDPGGVRVTGVRVLEAHHPRYDDPTTAVIVGDGVWYIANSHLARFDARTDLPDPVAWGPVLVLRAAL